MKVNRKVMAGAIALSAMLGISAVNNLNVSANESSEQVNDNAYNKFSNEAQGIHSTLVPAGHEGLPKGADGYSQFYVDGNRYDADNGQVIRNGQVIPNAEAAQDLKNDKDAASSGQQLSTQYQSSNTLPQTGERNSKSTALAGSVLAGLGLGLTGVDLAKKRMLTRP